MEENRQLKVTPDYIDQMLKKEDKTEIQYNTIIKSIKDNYETILKNTPNEFLIMVIIKLCQNQDLKKFMEDNFESIIKIIPKSSIPNVTNIYLYGKSDQDVNEFLSKITHILLAEINNENLADYLLIYSIKNISEEVRNTLNNKIKSNKKNFIRTYILKSEEYYSIDDDMLHLLEKLIEEILEHENKDWIDIEYIKSGAYSHVYKIGSKILKIGEERATYRIPYDKRILQPLIRLNLSDLSKTNKGTIEVSEEVDTNIDLTDEELYILYKELRERGIILADLKSQNLGRLLKDNKKYWNKSLSASKIALGYIDDASREEEILKQGEIVIIDTDYIFYEDDPNLEWGNGISNRLEKRYIQEKENSKNNLK